MGLNRCLGRTLDHEINSVGTQQTGDICERWNITLQLCCQRSRHAAILIEKRRHPGVLDSFWSIGRSIGRSHGQREFRAHGATAEQAYAHW